MSNQIAHQNDGIKLGKIRLANPRPVENTQGTHSPQDANAPWQQQQQDYTLRGCIRDTLKLALFIFISVWPITIFAIGICAKAGLHPRISDSDAASLARRLSRQEFAGLRLEEYALILFTVACVASGPLVPWIRWFFAGYHWTWNPRWPTVSRWVLRLCNAILLASFLAELAITWCVCFALYVWSTGRQTWGPMRWVGEEGASVDL